MTMQVLKPAKTYEGTLPRDHHYWSDGSRSVTPTTGRVLVLFDRIDPIRLVRGVWIVDKSAALERFRRGTVLAVSKQGKIILGGMLVPHEVQPGNRVLVERSASKLIPGQNHQAVRAGEVMSVWENYIAAIIEDESPDELLGVPETKGGKIVEKKKDD